MAAIKPLSILDSTLLKPLFSNCSSITLYIISKLIYHISLMPIPQTKILNRTFIRDDVYQSLREWIVRGDLEPGEKLKDKELAAQLGVSRTPVREALRKLENEGLVETSANRWTKVAPITIQDAERIYPIIQKLEELALILAFHKIDLLHESGDR